MGRGRSCSFFCADTDAPCPERTIILSGPFQPEQPGLNQPGHRWKGKKVSTPTTRSIVGHINKYVLNYIYLFI